MRCPKTIDQLVAYLNGGTYYITIHMPHGIPLLNKYPVKDAATAYGSIKNMLAEKFALSGYDNLEISVYDKPDNKKLFTHLYNFSDPYVEHHSHEVISAVEEKEQPMENRTSEPEKKEEPINNKTMKDEEEKSLVPPEMFNNIPGGQYLYLADFFQRRYNDAEREITRQREDHEREVTRLKGEIERLTTEIHNLRVQNDVFEQRKNLELQGKELDWKMEKNKGLGGLGDAVEKALANEGFVNLVQSFITARMAKPEPVQITDPYAEIKLPDLKEAVRMLCTLLIDKAKAATEEAKKLIATLFALIEQETIQPGYIALLVLHARQAAQNAKIVPLTQDEQHTHIKGL